MKRRIWVLAMLSLLAVGALLYVATAGQGPIIITGPVVHDADDVYWLLIDDAGNNLLELSLTRIAALESQVGKLTEQVAQLYYQLWDLRTREYPGDTGKPTGGFRASPPSSP